MIDTTGEGIRCPESWVFSPITQGAISIFKDFPFALKSNKVSISPEYYCFPDSRYNNILLEEEESYILSRCQEYLRNFGVPQHEIFNAAMFILRDHLLRSQMRRNSDAKRN